MTTPQNPHTSKSGSGPTGQSVDTDIFIGRQPILDNNQNLVAYELLFRGSAQAGTAVIADGLQATSRLVINTFNNFGVERVLGGRKAFLNVSESLLLSEVLELLPRELVVLEILEDIEPTEAVVERCRALRGMGYHLALDDFVYRREFDPLIPLASYIKFDLRALGKDGLAEQLRHLWGRGPAFLAEKVETREEFNACRDLNVDYYQGYYFAKPETLSMKRMDPSAQLLFHIFGLATGNAEPQKLEASFRQDVALSYNLLRYINSVGFGLAHKIESIRQALVILGSAKLVRWITLLMYSTTNRGLAPQALFRSALLRARLAEMLGAARLGAAHQDPLFMTGMFSLLDVMLGMPLADILKNLVLPQPVSSALIAGSGPYAPYLALAEACEAADLSQVDALAQGLGLSSADLARTQLEALAWVEQVSAVLG